MWSSFKRTLVWTCVVIHETPERRWHGSDGPEVLMVLEVLLVVVGVVLVVLQVTATLSLGPTASSVLLADKMLG